MSEYEQFLRDCVFNARNFDREPLKCAEIGMLIAHFAQYGDDLSGEALCDAPEAFADALKHDTPVGLAALVIGLLRRRCMAFIESDLRRTRIDMEDESRQDAEHEHGVTA